MFFMWKRLVLNEYFTNFSLFGMMHIGIWKCPLGYWNEAQFKKKITLHTFMESHLLSTSGITCCWIILSPSDLNYYKFPNCISQYLQQKPFIINWSLLAHSLWHSSTNFVSWCLIGFCFSDSKTEEKHVDIFKYCYLALIIHKLICIVA